MHRSVERKATFLHWFVTMATLCAGQEKVQGGHLKWMFEAKNGFSPHDTPFAPAIVRGKSPGDDRVAVLSQTANGNWAVDGLSIDSGAIQSPSRIFLHLYFDKNFHLCRTASLGCRASIYRRKPSLARGLLR